jgi:LytTr DNA-binding domain
VLREMQLLARWRREITVLLAIGALLGSLGPYGTYSCFAVPDRFGYWMLRSLLVGVICLGVLHAIMATKSCSSWSPTKKALAGVIVATMPCALIGFALASIFRHTPSTPLEIANLYGRVAIITMVVGIPLHLTRTMFAHGYEFLPAKVRPTRLAQSTEPTFLRRLPPKLGTDLLYIEVEDHYLRVHTSKGNDLLLMRLSDAVAELDQTLGRQVHRSYWVARRAVSAVDRDRYRVRLILINGARVPVSRTFLPKLRAEGWL